MKTDLPQRPEWLETKSDGDSAADRNFERAVGIWFCFCNQLESGCFDGSMVPLKEIDELKADELRTLRLLCFINRNFLSLREILRR